MVVAYYINVGYVANMVRGQNFPFNDCISRRLLFWNEVNFMTSATDTIKMLTAGDSFSVSVKYQGNSVISRTPVIFLSNDQVFNPHSPIWKPRMYFENWITSPFLADRQKYPHPLCLPLLFEKYIPEIYNA